MSRKQKLVLLLLIDSLIIVGANIFSYFYMAPYIEITVNILILSAVLQLAFYIALGFIFNIFTRINRFTNLKEMIAIFSATTIAWLAEVIILFSKSRRTLFLAYLITTFLIISSRLVWRLIVEWKRNGKHISDSKARKTLIIGAGEGGRILLTSLSNSSTSKDIKVVGFIDDASDKYRMYLGGIRVLGNTESIPTLVKEYGIEMLTVAIPSLKREELQRILDIVTPLGLPVNAMPALEELASGNITISGLKKINVVDLLGREEVQLDVDQLEGQITDKVILVTGAGGSIGSEICRQIMKFKPKQLLLLGHGENSIYLIHRELFCKYEKQPIEIIPIIADIQDKQRLVDVIQQYRPDIVYHAAAHKHVPLMEENPVEALKNNVFGTKNIAEAAKEQQVKTFVMISTDKAVNPPNVMGATKRIAEMIVTGMNEEGNTKFCAVRFGNVLGSRGSVIPVFEEQIQQGGPVTVTDFRMTRYFMTIPEASRLVIQAGALARGGELFILDMGEPVKIYDLAKKMIQLSGYQQDEIEIVETGIRPGEKLYEELLVSKEKNAEQVYDKIFIGSVNGFSIDTVMSFVGQLPEDKVEISRKLVEFANESNR
ncbi:polysaccharide biosynthesis protein [Enterococcus sp. CWB-B31]|uniref:polysaccharide biosynthesis protein n=1 Tax=Enterococcus sp. CWB-B31 TaxID=2885159 RepID=UPI001E3E73D4|nr:nucleoside-diphosphate sugar epimerase/dehydratase [Enterococcus sp. CWB-B31]MCB5954638.1 polysaccharide biosynthesis protein [Enterococcus sp. CWB-B31]